MPNVPNLPGVPPLLSYIANTVVLAVEDAVGVLLGLSSPQWGIYLDGVPAIEADSTVTFEYKQDWVVANYPVEQGGFESYDKVQMPFDVKVTMATGGSVSDRQALLDSVAAAGNTLNFYDVLTPEEVFTNCSINHWDQRRTASQGLGLLVVDIWLQEVRPAGAPTFSNTSQPSGANPQGGGLVQASTPNAMVSQDFSSFQ
jgi:hypothetical protein